MDHDDHTLVEAELPPYLDMGLFLIDLIDKVYEAEQKVFAQVEATLSKALGLVDEPEPKKVTRSKGKTTPSPEPSPVDTLANSLSHRADAMRYQRLLSVLQLYYTGTSIMFGMNPAASNAPTRMPQPDDDDDNLYEPPPLNPKKDTRMN